ncbi:MAG TPA: amino acid permease [Acidimicrobiales bacterium]|nr:amino acid permease [Acidimicrobiales bacterium]
MPTPTARKALSPPMATALVIGNMIGSGVFLLPAALAVYGGISIVAWLFTAAGAFFLALVFARLGRAYPRTGGPYAYSRRAFGDFVGFQTAWGYWIAAWVGNAAIAVAFVGYMGHFFDVFSRSSSGAKLAQVALATAAIWLLTWVNIRGLRQAGLVQTATTVLKIVPLVAIAALGLFWLHSGNFTPFNASTKSNFGAITAAATLTLWAFIGLESATVPAEDVADASRTIPRSTLIGTAITAVVYILGTVAVMGVIPMGDLANSTAPFADAATKMWGSWAGDAVALGAVISTFGCLNGWILLQGQVPFAAARDRLFPTEFSRLNRYGAPAVGLVVSSVLLTGLMLTNYNSSLVARFSDMVLLATLVTLVPYAYAAGAQLMLLATDRQRFSGKHFAVDITIAFVAFGYSAWMIVGSGYKTIAWGFMLLLAGVPVFVWMKWRAAVKEPQLAAEETPVDLSQAA